MLGFVRRCLSTHFGRPLGSAASASASNVFTTPPSPFHSAQSPKAGQLSQSQLKEFFENGFVVTPTYFDPKELQPVMNAIEECVDALAEKLYQANKISDRCKGAGLYERLTLIDKQFPGGAVLLHKMGQLPEAFRRLWADHRLLNVAQQIVGPNVAGHPVWNLRSKIPHSEQATVPWHQDTAYLHKSSWNTMQLTAWIPLLDANRQNGCMQVVRGGHRSGKTATHTCCAGGTWYVDLDVKEMEESLGVNCETDVVTCEVPLGGILWLNNVTPHRSLENYSNQIRWSLDLRWQNPDEPNGFWDLKDAILMRKASDPNYEIDWSKFADEDRTRLQHDRMVELGTMKAEARDDPFDSTIAGPWMNAWELTHHNRHTHAFLSQGNKNEVSGWHKA